MDINNRYLDENLNKNKLLELNETIPINDDAEGIKNISEIIADLNHRISKLDEKISQLVENNGDATGILSQISIIGSMLKFYNLKNTKFNNLKSRYYLCDSKVYKNVSQRERLQNINQEIDHNYKMNEYLNCLIMDQNTEIDNLSSYMSNANETVMRSDLELKRYRDNLRKKNRFYRMLFLFLLTVFVYAIYKLI